MDVNATPVQRLPGAVARWCGIVVGFCAATWLNQQATLRTQRASWEAARLGSLEVILLAKYLSVPRVDE
jgi:hypothetical protein